MTYHYATGGEQKGQATEEELRQMAAAGLLGPDALVWREGMAEWQPFAAVLGGGSQGAVQCTVCGQTFPAEDTIQYGTVRVCAGCKPRFVQGLREGAAAPGAMNYATTGSRAGAKVLDSLILYALQIGFSFLAAALSPRGGILLAVTTVFSFLIGIAYQGVFLGWRGQTPGKMAAKVKVVSPDGEPIGWGKAFGRPLAEMLSGMILGIGYLMAFWDPEKRTLHDRLAGTRVVKAK